MASLFEIINEGNVAQQQAQLNSVELQLRQVQTASSQMALQNQISFQRAMGQIYGPGTASNPSSDMDAAAAGDPAAQKRIQALQGAMMQFAPMDKAVGFMNSMEMTRKRQQEERWNQQRQVGSVFASIKNAEDYAAAAPEIAALGGYQKLGLTPDWNTSAARVGVLGRMGMTAGQEATNMYRDLNLQERIQHDQDMNDRFQRQQAEIKARAQETADYHAKLLAERAAQEARMQAGIQQRENVTLAREKNSLANPPEKTQQRQLAVGQTIAADDEWFQKLNPKMKQAVIQDASTMARNKMASAVKKPGDIPDITFGEAFADALQEVKAKHGKTEPGHFAGFELPFGIGQSSKYSPAGAKPDTYQPAKVATPQENLTPEDEAKVQAWMSNPANKGIPRDVLIEKARKAGLL